MVRGKPKKRACVKVSKEKWNFWQIQITCELLEQAIVKAFIALHVIIYVRVFTIELWTARKSVDLLYTVFGQIQAFTSRCQVIHTLSCCRIMAIETNLGRCHVRFISTVCLMQKWLFALYHHPLAVKPYKGERYLLNLILNARARHILYKWGQ